MLALLEYGRRALRRIAIVKIGQCIDNPMSPSLKTVYLLYRPGCDHTPGYHRARIPYGSEREKGNDRPSKNARPPLDARRPLQPLLLKSGLDGIHYDEPPCADPHAARGVGSGGETSLLPDYVLSSTDQRSPSATSLMILFRSLSKAAIYRVRNSLSATLPNNPKGAL